jgi:hypothetical protein
MDVTQDIINRISLYGGTPQAEQASLSAIKSLNLAEAPTIHNPAVMRVSAVPFTLVFEGEIGLFGAENKFIRVDLNITSQGFFVQCYEEANWDCLVFNGQDFTYPVYDQADVINSGDGDIQYQKATFNVSLPFTDEPDQLVSIDLHPNESGNYYADRRVSTQLYNKCKDEHAYDRLFCNPHSSFYVGIAARDTQRLPYKVSCKVGNVYTVKHELTEDEYRYIERPCH